QETRQVVRAEQIDFGLAYSAEQGVVFGRDGGRVQFARAVGQRVPGGFEQAAGRGGLLLQLRQQFGGWRRIEQVRQQAVDCGAGGVFVEAGGADGGERDGGCHRSVMRVSSGEEYRSMTRQSPHIFRRSSAAPWNMAWPPSRCSMVSMPFCVPNALPQRTQWKGWVSLSTTASLRRSDSSRRGTSWMASSGQVFSHNPHCTQFFSMKRSWGSCGLSC